MDNAKEYLEKALLEIHALLKDGKEKQAQELFERRYIEISTETYDKKVKTYSEAEYALDKASVEYVSTGYPELDKFVKIPLGYLTQIYMLTNHGKSMFMRNMCFNQAFNHDIKCAFISYEDSNHDMHNHFSYLYFLRKYSTGKLTNKKYYMIECLDYYDAILKKGNIFYDFDMAAQRIVSQRILTTDRQYNIAMIDIVISKLLDENQDLKIVYLDYVQKIPEAKAFGSRQEQIERVVNKLHEIARKYNVAIISAAQLNGKGVNGKKKTDYVQLYNVRSAADISNSARLILGGWNQTEFNRQCNEESFSEEKSTSDSIEIDILKQKRQRNGKGIKFKLYNKYANIVGE